MRERALLAHQAAEDMDMGVLQDLDEDLWSQEWYRGDGRRQPTVESPSGERPDRCGPRQRTASGVDEEVALNELEDEEGPPSAEFTGIDDVTGEDIPADLLNKARQEDIAFMQSWKVWEVCTREEAYRRTGKAPIGGRWVDHNKGDKEHPNIRCRYVAKDIARWKDDWMFVATPPL